MLCTVISVFVHTVTVIYHRKKQSESLANYVSQRHTLTFDINHLCKRKARHPRRDLECVKQNRLCQTHLFKTHLSFIVSNYLVTETLKHSDNIQNSLLLPKFIQFF